ncbi:Hypothetical protein FKW44_004884 [Caligus rogercresseyi]|uniref:Uncharacterized protein n=1 Tax=Caligus rogercresseyi TaxID=217165 RepID=A0A7T8KBD4_CALRO|nr:Hypothetical protein FKW44_004884 [Caligus rogercresseyi]
MIAVAMERTEPKWLVPKNVGRSVPAKAPAIPCVTPTNANATRPAKGVSDGPIRNMPRPMGISAKGTRTRRAETVPLPSPRRGHGNGWPRA